MTRTPGSARGAAGNGGPYRHHGPEVRAEALRLVAAGVNDCEIARRLGVARTTIRDWRRPTYVSRRPRAAICPRCWRPSTPISFTPDDYAELLGLNLGDGCISSDGCAFVNRTGRYEYLSYGFANLSVDILDLFEATCLAVGLRPRRYATAIRLNRREDASRLLAHVGLKS